MIHSVLWGIAPLITKNGFRYFINFLDNYSQFNWIYPLKTKNEALQVFKQFKNMAKKKQFNSNVKILHTDSGGEFQSFSHFLKEHGIIQLLTCPYT